MQIGSSDRDSASGALFDSDRGSEYDRSMVDIMEEEFVGDIFLGVLPPSRANAPLSITHERPSLMPSEFSMWQLELCT